MHAKGMHKGKHKQYQRQGERDNQVLIQFIDNKQLHLIFFILIHIRIIFFFNHAPWCRSWSCNPLGQDLVITKRVKKVIAWKAQVDIAPNTFAHRTRGWFEWILFLALIQYKLENLYPNICVSLRIFLTILPQQLQQKDRSAN